MTTTAATRRDTTALIAGIALIVLPLIGAAFKVFWPGWMLLVIFFFSPLLLLGYALQIVIAGNVFLRRHSRLQGNPRRRPTLWAAWLTSIGVVVTGLFFVDGGDSSWGSAFMYLVGAPSNDAVAALSSVLAWIGGVAWIGGWGWLVVEWIRTLSGRRRR